MKTAKPIHRPSMGRRKLVNSPFSNFEGTYGCRPKKNRANKIHRKVMMLVQSYSLLYMYVFFHALLRATAAKT